MYLNMTDLATIIIIIIVNISILAENRIYCNNNNNKSKQPFEHLLQRIKLDVLQCPLIGCDAN